jgi:hypothetical protein
MQFRVDEEFLDHVFAPFGALIDVIVKRHEVRASPPQIRGYGNAYFTDTAAAMQAVVALKGVAVCGVHFECSLTMPRAAHGAHGARAVHGAHGGPPQLPPSLSLQQLQLRQHEQRHALAPAPFASFGGPALPAGPALGSFSSSPTASPPLAPAAHDADAYDRALMQEFLRWRATQPPQAPLPQPSAPQWSAPQWSAFATDGADAFDCAAVVEALRRDAPPTAAALAPQRDADALLDALIDGDC